MAKTPRARDLQTLGHPKTLRIGKRRFVVGLFWQVAGEPKTAAREARETARNPSISANLLLTRGAGGEVQFALARLQDGVPPGAVSAAAALSDTVPAANWVGAFEIGGGYWFVAVRDGLIVPGGDRFYVEADECKRRLKLEIDEGGWERIFAPEAWQVADADDLDPLQPLAQAKGPKITQTNPLRKHLKTLLVVGVLGAAVGASWYGWVQHQAEQEKQQRIIEARKKLAELDKQKEVEPPRPWRDAPPVSGVIEVCLEGMNEIRTNVPGFRLTKVACDGRRAEYAWRREENASLQWIQRWIARQGDYRVQIGEDGEAAAVAVRVEPPADRGEEPLLPREEVRTRLLSYGQVTDARIDLDEIETWSPPPGSDRKFKEPDYVIQPFEMRVTSLRDWGGILSQAPGMVIDVIVWDARQQDYTITGDVYVQR